MPRSTRRYKGISEAEEDDERWVTRSEQLDEWGWDDELAVEGSELPRAKRARPSEMVHRSGMLADEAHQPKSKKLGKKMAKKAKAMAAVPAARASAASELLAHFQVVKSLY